MKATDAALALIRRFEGVSLKRYICPAGKPTIGVGHVILPHEDIGGFITPEKANELLAKDVENAESIINDAVKVDLHQNGFDALVSFVFNVGGTAFRKSTMLRLINEDKFDEVGDQFGRWVYSNGHKLPGLVTRREAEAALWRDMA